MDLPKCSSCMTASAEVIVLPGNNPDVVPEYLCVGCFTQCKVQDYKALPYAYIEAGEDGQARGLDVLFEEKANGLVAHYYHYQDEVRERIGRARATYDSLFNDLMQQFTVLRDRTNSLLEESLSVELEHINSTIDDLRVAAGRFSLHPNSAYLAPIFNSPTLPYNEELITIPDNLEEFRQIVGNFPTPAIKLTTYGAAADKGEKFRRTTTINTIRRLIEDETIIMPIDTLNLLLCDFSKEMPERRMIPCSHFPYRIHAKWCKMNDDLYLYSGGLYKGAPVAWCDFIDVSEIRQEVPEVRRLQGKEMKQPRLRHAVICHENVVYAFGGTPVEQGRRISNMEVLPLSTADWSTSEWQLASDMPELFDPTATVLKSAIYLAGKSRSIFRYDIVERRFTAIKIFKTISLQVNMNPQQDGIVQSDLPLPRQSTNSLIFSWQAQLVVLQHDYMYFFSPASERIEIQKKKVSAQRAWCCPFPVIIKGSKGYFMLEPAEGDSTSAEDVWCFDFVKKDVSLVQFVFQSIAQDLSLQRDIYDKLAAYKNTRKPIIYSLLAYYGQSFVFTGCACYILRAESLTLRVLTCGFLMIAYLLNGQLRVERDLLFRLALTEKPGAATIRSLYISRASDRWPGSYLSQFQAAQDARLQKYLPRADPLQRFRGLKEFAELANAKCTHSERA